MRSSFFNLGFLSIAIMIVAAAIVSWWLASPLLSEGLRPAIGLALSVAINLILLLWGVFPNFKAWVSKIHYRFFGPSTEVQVLGTVSLVSDSAPYDTLNQVKDTARKWWDNARIDAEMGRRVIVSSGVKTLMATLSDNEDEDEATYLSVEIRGYRDKVTALDDVLRREIKPLLADLSMQCSDCTAWDNLSLNLLIGGRNPFLGFYLRGVPIEDIKLLQIKLDVKRRNYSDAHIEILIDRVSIQASEPEMLVEAARDFLTAPPLKDSR